MIFNIFFFIVKPEIKFWVSAVFLLILTLGILANKLTKGNAIAYLNYEMNESLKLTFFIIQTLGSLILALLLPNNYLNEIDFIKKLYDENDLWIAGTVLILIFFFIISVGTAFTLFSKLTGLKNDDQDGMLEEPLDD